MATIRKKNNSYEIAVSCGYGADGKQIRRFLTYKPDKGMTPKKIENEVKRQAVLFEEQCKYGQAAANGKIKLCDFIPIYFENAKNNLSEYNYKAYQRTINKYIIPALGHFKLKDITPRTHSTLYKRAARKALKYKNW